MRSQAGHSQQCSQRAFSLLELVVVLAILVALGGMAVRMASPAKDDAHRQASRASLLAVRDAMVQYWSDTKYIPLDAETTAAGELDRFHLRWMFHNPIDDSTIATASYRDTRIGWNGPYLMSATGSYAEVPAANFTTRYGLTGDPAILDAYASATVAEFAQGHPIVVQDVNPLLALRDVRIVSAGPNGIIDLPPTVASEDLTALDIGDDLYVAITLR